MNHGAHDDPADYGEVAGHGPTVILSHLDGDEVTLPGAVEHRLRDERAARLAEFRGVWRQAREHEDATRPEPPPPESIDDYGADDGDESVDETPPVMAPIYGYLLAAVCVQVFITVLLVALRVGGALDWSWGWVLAPLWVPSTVATVLVVAIGLALVAMDERDAARRRRA